MKEYNSFVGSRRKPLVLERTDEERSMTKLNVNVRKTQRYKNGGGRMDHVLQLVMAIAISAITMFILDGSASETFIAAIVTLVYLEPKEA